MKICPKCGKKAHRSQRRGSVEKILKPLRIHPYRCRDCGLRFYRFSIHDHRKVRRSEPGMVARDNALSGSDSEKNQHQTIVSMLREGEKKAGLTLVEAADNADKRG